VTTGVVGAVPTTSARSFVGSIGAISGHYWPFLVVTVL